LVECIEELTEEDMPVV